MSAAKRQQRFGYLTQRETPQPEASPETEGAREKERRDELEERSETSGTPVRQLDRGGGETGPSTRYPEDDSPVQRHQGISSVPKGRGRMKQERSQLNVRIPTALKRQASAKAMLEGRDIGEVVEELLSEYLER